MITGIVNADLEAVIRFPIRGPNGQALDVEAIVDTGFNGFLTLPPALVTTLGLPRLGRGRVMLANGSEQIIDIHRATVIWDGEALSEALSVEADAVDAPPLIGMALLYGYELAVEVIDGGSVVIKRPA
jgi:clan AA aspartic protease